LVVTRARGRGGGPRGAHGGVGPPRVARASATALITCPSSCSCATRYYSVVSGLSNVPHGAGHCCTAASIAFAPASRSPEAQLHQHPEVQKSIARSYSTSTRSPSRNRCRGAARGLSPPSGLLRPDARVSRGAWLASREVCAHASAAPARNTFSCRVHGQNAASTAPSGSQKKQDAKQKPKLRWPVTHSGDPGEFSQPAENHRQQLQGEFTPTSLLRSFAAAAAASASFAAAFV